MIDIKLINEADTKLMNAVNDLDDVLVAQRKIASKLIKEHKQLQEALATMCSNADEDCPPEFRTEHFRSAITNGYDLLKKVGYFKNKKRVYKWDI